MFGYFLEADPEKSSLYAIAAYILGFSEEEEINFYIIDFIIKI